jgi:actin-related protein 9
VNEGVVFMNGGLDDARKVDSSVKASRYLVGHVLDEALAAGESIRISWPFRNGDIDDWEQAEALW